MAPLVTKVVINEKLNKCGWCSMHREKGWYNGPALNHYHCWMMYVTKSVVEHVVDTVELFLHQCLLPKLSSTDLATKLALELTNSLKI